MTVNWWPQDSQLALEKANKQIWMCVGSLACKAKPNPKREANEPCKMLHNLCDVCIEQTRDSTSINGRTEKKKYENPKGVAYTRCLSVSQGVKCLEKGSGSVSGSFFSVCNEAWVLTGLKQVIFFIAKLLIRLVRRAHLIEIRKQLLDILLEACNLSRSLWKEFFHRVSAWLNVFCCQTWCPSKSCS